MRFTRTLKRLFVVLLCFLGSGLAPILATFGLNDAARLGSGLLVACLWLLALVALFVMATAWIADVRLGKFVAVTSSVLGAMAVIVYPFLAGIRGESQWFSEFSGALGVEVLATLPSVVLAIYLAKYHASAASKGAA